MKEQIKKHPAKTWLFQAKRSPCHPVFFVENYLVDIFLSRVKFNMKCRNICFIFSFCGSNPEHMSRKHAFVQWQNLAQKFPGKEITQICFSLSNFVSNSLDQGIQTIFLQLQILLGKLRGKGLVKHVLKGNFYKQTPGAGLSKHYFFRWQKHPRQGLPNATIQCTCLP